MNTQIDNNQNDETSKGTCRFFKNGNFKYEENCRFKHIMPIFVRNEVCPYNELQNGKECYMKCYPTQNESTEEPEIKLHDEFQMLRKQLEDRVF